MVNLRTIRPYYIRFFRNNIRTNMSMFRVFKFQILPNTKRKPNVVLMLAQHYDAGPTLKQHLVNSWCSLGAVVPQ